FNPAGSLTLGFYVPAVKRELFRAICFFLLFLITLNLVNEKKQCQRLILVIIFFGLGLSFYGVVNKFFILNKDIAHTFSTFGNRNNFSGYMIMVVPLTVGYALSCRQKAKKFLFGFIAALISASVLLSLSRAGSLSLFFSLFLMFILAKREKTHFKAYWLFPAVFAMGAIFIFMAGVGPIQERFGLFGSGLSGRIGLAKDSLGLVKDFPIFGIGWGNFQYLFTFYKQFVSTAHYYYLHNDHLQLVVEIGLIAASAYFYFLYRLFKDIFGQLEKRHDLFVKNIVIGGVSGTLGVFVHSFVEFNFHIPAILFLFWFILGLVYKCVYTHFE
ncbi:MAG: O-antigen ligase family protein, partial [Candidatus Omnitrophica bacterium]|nr:O-antigen ligase family protein [Candidatus Omnitrophota bacterium]